MARTPSPAEDYSLFLSENGHLSFENPNYQLEPIGRILDPALMEDHINSNIEPSVPLSVYQELLELEGRHSLSNSSSSIRSSGSRKQYASLDINTMGVDTERGPITHLDNKIATTEINDTNKMTESIAEKTAKLQRLLGDSDKERFDLESPESEKLTDSVSEKEEKEIDEAEEELVKADEDLAAREEPIYAVPVKRRQKKEELPPGWEKHEDGEGFYYWHITTGTIQREPPHKINTREHSSNIVRNVRNSRIFDSYDSGVEQELIGPGIQKSSTTTSISDIGRDKREERNDFASRKEDEKWKRRSLPSGKVQDDSSMSRSSSSGSGLKPMQVEVVSLGWCELAEDDLTSENSSKAVNRCIVELSTKAEQNMERSGVWGEGRDLILELDEGSLKLLDPESGQLLNSQQIHTIRVWGVGRDNCKDFAYVSRDKSTRKHMCHVFRCQVPARTIANTLRDICKKILIERSLAQSSSKLTEKLISSDKREKAANRPSSLAVDSSRLAGRVISRGDHHGPETFPTPMEEPRKVLKAWYLGSLQVTQSGGIETVNAAIDELTTRVPREEWRTVAVGVAPSTVQISFMDGLEPIDCRVRFLSFLGIGKNVQQAAFIMHTAQDTFKCHVFHCEPTAGPLCKTIEAACKLRYQKCLDARPTGSIIPEHQINSRNSIGLTIKNMLGAFTKKGNS